MKNLVLSCILFGVCFIGQIQGQSNTVYGTGAGESNETGIRNAFFGFNSGKKNISGSRNTFSGYGSGENNTGNNNTFSGYESGYNNTTGALNTFSGYQSGYSNTRGRYNTFLGSESGYSNTTAGLNTFSGYRSGYSNTTGSLNTFSGYRSGYNNTTGIFNTFSGSESGYSNTTGILNAFSGYRSGYSNTTGRYNTFSGSASGRENITGALNTFLGASTGLSNTKGSSNIYVGYQAGMNNNGNDNVFIGRKAGIGLTETNHKLYIQNGQINDTPLLYGDFTTGNVGIGNTNTFGYKLHVNGNVFATELWISSTILNPGFAKSKSQPIENALEKIQALNSTINTATVKTSDKKPATQTQYTVNAADLQKVFPDLVKQHEGSTAINYQGLIPVLIEALKENSKAIEALQTQNEALQQQVEELKNSESSQGNNTQGTSLNTSGFKLSQNIPNPFESSTTIKYHIPEGYYQSASIQIFDGNGIVKRSFTNLQSGDGEVTINNSFLPAGIYHYSLIVNGKAVSSKKMVIKK